MKQFFYLFGLLLVLACCTKEVKIAIPGYKEELVIDGRIETGQPPIVILSKTKDIYAPTDMNAVLNGFVSGAIVTVSDGTNTVQLDEICSDNLPSGTETMAAALFGIPASELANYHICVYTTFNTAIWGQVGKNYSLTVQYAGKTYHSSTDIVQPTALDSVWWKQQANAASGYGFSWAKLSEPANQRDAYFWEVKRLNKGENGLPKDNAFRPTFNPAFNDEFISGKTFDFSFENPLDREKEIPKDKKWYYAIGDTVIIKFSKIDLNVYEFMEKKYTQLQSTGNPFASPTKIPSNITGGALGVWAGFSPYFDTLICQP